MSNDLRDKGIQIANDAVQHDNAQRYDEAIKGYIKAAEYLLTATKYEKNPVTLKTIRDKCVEYTVRAELLQKSLVANQTVANGLALLAAQAPLEPGQLLEDVPPRPEGRQQLEVHRTSEALGSNASAATRTRESNNDSSAMPTRIMAEDVPLFKKVESVSRPI